MKYIVFQDNKSGLLHPVIFGEHTTHSEVTINDASPISAGFFYLDAKKGLCVYGESDSLNLKPRKEDPGLLKLVLVNAGTSFFIQLDKLDRKEADNV